MVGRCSRPAPRLFQSHWAVDTAGRGPIMSLGLVWAIDFNLPVESKEGPMDNNSEGIDFLVSKDDWGKTRFEETPVLSWLKAGLFLEKWATGFGYRIRFAFGWALLCSEGVHSSV